LNAAREETSKGVLDRLYEFFCSIKLSIFVLIALALTSIFGTFIEQGKAPAQYVREYGPGIARAIQLLNLDDMYHAWWFQVLLALLLANITLCSIRRFPNAFKLMRDADPVFEGRPVALHERFEWTVKGLTKEEAAEKVERVLSEQEGKPLRGEAQDNTYFFVSRGGWARMGVYVTHFSLFLFAVGALVGSRWGFKGFVEIPEGQSVNEVSLRGGGMLPLGFEVRCDDFTLTNYPDGRPKAYLSDLAVLENGREVVRKTIAVNSPLIYKGIYFYQSSYGQAVGSGATLSVFGAQRNLIAHQAHVAKGAGLDLEDGTVLELLDLTTDYQGTGPAILVRVQPKGGAPGEPVVVSSMRGQSFPVGNYLVALNRVDSVMFTGLQVAKDPGVPLIWAGCVLITAGLLVAFFGSHKRIWARVSTERGSARILLAGNASRNRSSFEQRFRALCDRAKETIGK
jgi:cytochrome c biogenesis protein